MAQTPRGGLYMNGGLYEPPCKGHRFWSVPSTLKPLYVASPASCNCTGSLLLWVVICCYGGEGQCPDVPSKLIPNPKKIDIPFPRHGQCHCDSSWSRVSRVLEPEHGSSGSQHGAPRAPAARAAGPLRPPGRSP